MLTCRYVPRQGKGWLPSAQCHPTCVAGKGRGRKGQGMTTCPTMLSSCLLAKEGNDFNLGQNCSIALSGNCLTPLCSCWLMSLTLSSQCPFYGLPLPESTPGIQISLDRCAGLPFFCGAVSAIWRGGWSQLCYSFKVNGGGRPQAVSSSLLCQQLGRRRCSL